MVIGSGDLDFVPLAVRLRERGIKVICISEQGKMAQDAVRAYDQVVYVGGEKIVRPVVAPPEEKPVAAPPAHTVSKKAVAKKSAAKTAKSKVATAKKAPAAPEAVTVTKILAAVPNLKAGQWQTLAEVAKLLHDQKLLAKSSPSTKLFKKFPHHFELLPAGKPNQVRFILPLA